MEAESVANVPTKHVASVLSREENIANGGGGYSIG